MHRPSPLRQATTRRVQTLRVLFIAVLIGSAHLVTAPQVSAEPSGWRWPVEAAPQVTRPFALDTPYGPGHRGIDIAADPGSEVFAPAAGVVRFAGYVVDRPVLSVQHPDGAVTSYEPVVSDLAPGAPVLTGQRVGVLSPDHRHTPDGSLHVGLRLAGVYLDPGPSFDALRPRAAVLLPLSR
ncbi:murein hydrolase activator EnvC family protein [Pseudoclavibacter terrae]|uniref:Peptidoglycan DD-metalloendopeptidase family protein n=1 Tax=Pseudoclavibacter terrae TaxID=1530195 RepID=A0A7J5AY00_9MICO|nr:M23 family metallopeptidase [Pseudoclavibacter terrae]KAB1636359.1 peptidoglycan DD-metalloendopeptidase family protein [Pseudoclavibacter terrae]